MDNTIRMLIENGRTDGLAVKIGKLYLFGLLTETEVDELMGMLSNG